MATAAQVLLVIEQKLNRILKVPHCKFPDYGYRHVWDYSHNRNHAAVSGNPYILIRKAT